MQKILLLCLLQHPSVEWPLLVTSPSIQIVRLNWLLQCRRWSLSSQWWWSTMVYQPEQFESVIDYIFGSLILTSIFQLPLCTKLRDRRSKVKGNIFNPRRHHLHMKLIFKSPRPELTGDWTTLASIAVDFSCQHCCPHVDSCGHCTSRNIHGEWKVSHWMPEHP